MGNKLVKGGPLEPAPIAGKNGVLDLAVQAAHDAEYLYFRFQLKTNMAREGRMHDYIRFDGKEWKFWGGHRAKESVRAGKEPPLYEDRLSIMLDDGKVPLYARQGCWLTCHNGMRNMPGEAKKDEVEKHPYLGKGGLDKDEVLKYLPASRADAKSWDKPKTMTPKFMFDAKKVGAKALRDEDIGNPAKPAALLREENTAPYDPNAGWKEGDMLPGRLVSRADAKGSAADNDATKGAWKDGVYTLGWRRKLDTGNPADDKIMKAGGAYTVSFAVHDDNTTTRFHHVSFPLSLGIGTKADIQAMKLN